MAKSMKSVPLKGTVDIDFAKSLKSRIRRFSTNEEEAMQVLQTLSKSRNAALLNVPDRHENGLNTIMRYYDQFVSMEKRFPISENSEVRLSFTWRDAFGSKGMFGQKKAISNSGFEKVSVLFNVAAFMTQIAGNVRSTDDTSMQNAMKLYQQASGIFEYIKDNTGLLVGQTSTNDLSSEFLGFLAVLCQAQAQECIWIKAYTSGKMKPKILSQVTAGVSDLYDIALSRANQNKNVSAALKDEYNWIGDLQAKADHYKALAHYYAGKELRRLRDTAGAEMKYGEEISRYQAAESCLKSKTTLELLPNTFKADLKSELNVATKDNNLIYHESVPDPKTLPFPDKNILAKPLTFEPNKQLSKDAQDLFSCITPVAIASAMDHFNQKKMEYIRQQNEAVREANDTLNGILASLNLPAAIEETRSGELPASLWEKAEKLQNQGGIDYIDRFISELPVILERNKDILNEAMRILKDEKEQDDKLRQQYKDKWSRTPSESLTQQLREDQSKYQTLLQRATEADAKVKSQFEANVDSMRVLSLPKGEIENRLPSSQSGDVTRSSEAQELKQLMKQVDAIKVERSKIEDKLHGSCDVDKIRNKFLAEMTPEGTLNGEVFTDAFLQEEYGDAEKDFQETLEKQEALLEKIQSANNRFVQISSGNNEVRDSFLRQLASAYDAFETLVNHLKEGQKFYADLTEILLTHQSKVKDFVFARNTEKEDLLKEITANVSQPTGQPAAPSYHANIPASNSTGAAPAAAVAPPSSTSSTASAAGSQMNSFNVQQPPYGNPAQPQQPVPSYNPYMPMAPQMYNNPYGAYGAPQGMAPPNPYYPQYPGYAPYGQQPVPGYPGQQPGATAPPPMYGQPNPYMYGQPAPNAGTWPGQPAQQ